ncbi:MAG: ABC transporter substrate-binding protein [Beijerinckiaceae bacterium]|nr:ABC transporter substrate-binding protein [Beijerinckiaceae bacterium]
MTQTLSRRRLMQIGAATLASPAIVRAQPTSVLRFVPYADLALLDPILTTNYVTRAHAQMVFDTLYGMDDALTVRPQMVEGDTVSEDGLTWRLKLRSGLMFHDRTPVLGRDVVASLTRWSKRDAFGSALFAVVAELSSPDDRTIEFKLQRPFPLLREALAKPTSYLPVIMPERLALTSPFSAVSEIIGSGPYRYAPEERVPGSLNVFKRFDAYVPCADGTPSFTAGPRIAHFERIEWRTMPDGNTAASALRAGEIDWWEQPNVDLLPLLARDQKLKIDVVETRGLIGQIRLNHLHPPFDKPAVCRALLGAIDQTEMMEAVAGTDPSVRRGPCGVFTPGGPMDSAAGMEALTSKRDIAKVKKALADAGYNGEKISLLAGTDVPRINAICEVIADTCRRLGMNLDYVATDWGTVNQRILNQKPPEQGGWNMYGVFSGGLDFLSPAYHLLIRGIGAKGPPSWLTDPEIETLRGDWFKAADLAGQKTLAAKIQVRALEVGAFIPCGQYFQPTVYRRDLTGMLSGLPLFWNVRRG